jgi:hypothetical protein
MNHERADSAAMRRRHRLCASLVPHMMGQGALAISCPNRQTRCASVIVGPCNPERRLQADNGAACVAVNARVPHMVG